MAEGGPSMGGKGDNGQEFVGPAAAYSAAVAEWLNQAYHAQMIQIGFSSFLAQQSLANVPSQSSTSSSSVSSTSSGGSSVPNPGAAQQQAPPIQAVSQMLVYRIPPMWRRMVAEALDVIILFTLKLIITFTAIDFFEVLDPRTYGMDALINVAQRIDDINLGSEEYESALAFTSEILIFEMIHRIVVCLFEALCIQRGPAGIIGGATPGKVLMGLKVVKCEQIISLGGNQVGVNPGSNLGLWWALWRSALKNFCIAFLVPLTFSIMFMPFNRTVYDILTKSLVVESENRIVRNR